MRASQMWRAIRCCLLLATHASALRLSPVLVRRREALSLAALAPALAPALPACAAAPPIGRSEGGVLWELELPYPCPYPYPSPSPSPSPSP